MPTVAQHYISHKSGVRAHEPRADAAAPVVLMVSGGADSTALLLMACTGTLDLLDGRGRARIARERLHVLHVNHHLRGEASDGDEVFVRSLCEEFGLPLCVEHAMFDDLDGQNLEAAARDVRYAAARRYVRKLSTEMGTPRSAARILTAHTASDRAETFFMNAVRGSGATGLASIPRRRNIIVRPLLDMTHEELVRYLEVRGRTWREDASNKDTNYLRNFVRHDVMPLLAERNPNVARSVSGACELLGDEDAFLSQLSATALRACTKKRESGIIVIDARKLAAAEVVIARRMVRAAVKSLNGDCRLEMSHVEAVLACVAAGSGSVTLPLGIDARMEFGTLTIRTARARENVTAGWLTVPGSFVVGDGVVLAAEAMRVQAGQDPIELAREAARGEQPTLLVDAASLGYAERDCIRLLEETPTGVPGSAREARLWVDAPAPGDVMCPFGMSGRSKKVSDLLGEARVPVAERLAVPVVRTAPGGSIVWLVDVRSDERFKCTAQTRVVIKIMLADSLADNLNKNV